jgi:hypothetical protein
MWRNLPFLIHTYTGHTQKNGAVSIVNSFETAPFFCVCPLYDLHNFKFYYSDKRIPIVLKVMDTAYPESLQS